MHDGLEVTSSNPLGLVQFNCNASRHGDICLYDVATIPAEDHTAWFPAPDPDVINLVRVPSYVCQAPVRCWRYGDFSYFQTFVDIPENVEVTQFTIGFRGMDDGSRITIFNSLYPGGLVIPGSYVYLGGSGTSNLAPFVAQGEVNRVVITQVDDCCYHNYLREAFVILNGEVVNTNNAPVAQCQDLDLSADATCAANGSVEAGSYDPDGDELNISVEPQGPYGLGETVVTVTACDAELCDSCEGTVSVVDDTPPTVSCEAPETITPPDAPVTFYPAVEDNCAVEYEFTGYDCFKFNKKGKRIDKTGSCIVEFSEDGGFRIIDSGGVDDHITWSVVATDSSGNATTAECELLVVNPGSGGEDCNQGVGNNAEGCDPGNSNQGNPDNSNDENGGVPGNPGKKNK